MRQPPRKLDVNDDSSNPECFNVKIHLCGVEQKGVISYDLDKHCLVRYKEEKGKPVLKHDCFDMETINFTDGDLVITWLDESKVL